MAGDNLVTMFHDEKQNRIQNSERNRDAGKQAALSVCYFGQKRCDIVVNLEHTDNRIGRRRKPHWHIARNNIAVRNFTFKRAERVTVS